MGDEFDFENSLHLLQESSDRWGPQAGAGEPSDSRKRSLERFAHVLVQLMDEAPSWMETVMHPLAGDDGETEVRALGEKALYTVSNRACVSRPATSILSEPVTRPTLSVVLMTECARIVTLPVRSGSPEAAPVYVPSVTAMVF